MWRRHGCRRKPAHETENNLFIKGWDAGCGGKLCSQAVDTEWGLLGWLPSPHHYHGSMMVAPPKKLEKEICAFPNRRAELGHVLRPGTRELLCVCWFKTHQESGWQSCEGVWLIATHLQVL